MATDVIDLKTLNPKVIEIVDALAITSGLTTRERTIEELAFTVQELIQVIDTEKDPLLEPDAASKQMATLQGSLQRYKRFPKK